MSTHHRWARFGRAVGVVALTVSVAAAAAPAAAAPPQRPIVGSASGTATPAGTPVTLITGDLAVHSVDAAGRPSASLVPGPNADPDGYITRVFRGDVYVVPARAVPMISEGALDEQLFNVSALVRQGYDDRSAAALPLLATYGGAVTRTRQAPQAPQGATVEATLPVADAVALSADKEQAAEFWRDLTDGDGPRIAKLWLDERVSVTMAESAAQIHAPQAWAAGFDGTGATVAVLDSGYDGKHPDLAGQVAGAKNFTTDSGGADVDLNGHGTHVASTVAGTGVASDGVEKGVAPGAKLLIGKVLNRYGQGQESWIINGMQWAVDHKADVISMSLGGSVGTDCTDPIGVAAQALAQQSTSLFVVAAGNAGPTLQTISAPACAKDVLTVGAVDSAGQAARFTSRGPVVGTHTVKPEIAAPGVEILAAESGTGRYTRMSGTSMATPHVAAVAALLKQKHPGWTAQQRKAALISAATPSTTGRVHEVGAGVVDALRPLTAAVVGPGVVDAGSYAWPHLHQPKTTTTVTLTNTGDKAVAFDLAIAGATAENGAPLPKRTFAAGIGTVTVPAHGTAEVPVVLDPAVKLRAAEYGAIGARLVATAADGSTVVTAIAAYLEPHAVTVKLKLIDRRGEVPAAPSFVDVVDADRLTALRFTSFTTEPTLRLREGRYSINALIASRDAGTTEANGLVHSVTFMGDPELVVNNDDVDRTITYDARTAVRQKITAERPTEAQSVALEYGRWWDAAYISGGYTGGKSVDEVYVGRTTPVTDGGFQLGSYYRLYAPELVLRTTGGIALDPVYIGPSRLQAGVPTRFDGSGTAELVDAGAGSQAELVTAAGKIALVHSTDVARVLTAAAAADVKAVLFARDEPGRWSAFAASTIPGLTVTTTEESALRAALAAGPVTLAWDAVVTSPYVYNVAFADERMTQPDVPLQVREKNLARVDERIHSTRTNRVIVDGIQFFPANYPSTVSLVSDTFAVPVERASFVTAGVQTQRLMSGASGRSETMFAAPRTAEAGSVRSEDWYRGPMRSTGTRRADLSAERIAERQEGQIGASMLVWGDSDPDHYGFGGFGDVGNAELFADGVSLGRSAWPQGIWDVPDDDAAYRLRVTTMRFNPGQPNHPNWSLFYSTETEFRFRSQRPSDNGLYALPILVPSYDIAVDTRNLTPATAGFEIGFGGAGQRDYDAGQITAAQAWVSFDDGTTWQEVTVTRRGAGFVTTVDQSAGAGKNVSLRVDLRDEHGNGVRQTIIRAYGVR
ncbi:Serine protease, subtilisin family [Micromonospora pallida]|uniref:Serine protease, subtilisin family n=1 Tax=Micromonospora pallida TaxID=145854 RepID=A0A1C6RV71_9ACTN|nr:S8 family peptidase [Micromonospora pallida]SCL21024.1 Serine protease, subtilisin family [Micromonospora pallida]